MDDSPAPVDMENLPLFTGFYTFQVVNAGSLQPSIVFKKATALKLPMKKLGPRSKVVRAPRPYAMLWKIPS